MDAVPEIDRICSVEKIPPICRQDAVVVGQIERIDRRQNDAQRLLPCVV